ncbi:MAG: dihydroorotate dehydrogenase electron transfer subunit [Prevotella sp.]|uniref:dihydroorotate dehydrogenase electron transfer subunit n=1 Tax=Prevotella sp. AGR2160 TaxID=1280674 RepID=UPI00041DD614|nr:dihydroorotate dehydrogenase electron transfer subunit [Prevotella sp. AGR2160]MDD5862232.1 dihydroorotate dehydrogenase electron transfer subunit [Prevotella sp.]
MKKYILDLRVASVDHVSPKHVLLKLTQDAPLPETHPGQFVEVRVDHSPTTFLRRPISINFVDRKRNELWLLVAAIGDGTKALARLKAGDTLNCVFPLGNGFTLPEESGKKTLLIGGGVGVAPLYDLGCRIKANGGEPTFLLGARSARDLLELDLFDQVGRVFVTTEDASVGEKGFVTQHSILQQEYFDYIYTCGPKPMMMSVARYAREKNIPCEASLENMMACGVGACLCCVEKTIKGNERVCQDGPVFSIDQLLWK